MPRIAFGVGPGQLRVLCGRFGNHVQSVGLEGAVPREKPGKFRRPYSRRGLGSRRNEARMCGTPRRRRGSVCASLPRIDARRWVSLWSTAPPAPLVHYVRCHCWRHSLRRGSRLDLSEMEMGGYKFACRSRSSASGSSGDCVA